MIPKDLLYTSEYELGEPTSFNKGQISSCDLLRLNELLTNIFWTSTYLPLKISNPNENHSNDESFFLKFSFQQFIPPPPYHILSCPVIRPLWPFPLSTEALILEN
jgi:hypothetical protein